jgi:hypothetical protein
VGKVLALLGVVAVAALGWALWPASPSDGTSSKPAAKSEAAAAKSEAPASPREGQPARVPKAPNPAEGVAVAPVVPEPAAAPSPAVPPPPSPAQALPAGGAPAVQGGLARAPDSPMPKARYADVKSHVRRFYGSLPANGRVPQPLYAEDLIPPALLSSFNVPPRSTLKMVSHYPATDAAGLKEILEMNEGGTSAVGFTFVTPDGVEVRDYAFLEP